MTKFCLKAQDVSAHQLRDCQRSLKIIENSTGLKKLTNCLITDGYEAFVLIINNSSE